MSFKIKQEARRQNVMPPEVYDDHIGTLFFF